MLDRNKSLVLQASLQFEFHNINHLEDMLNGDRSMAKPLPLENTECHVSPGGHWDRSNDFP